MGIAVMIGALIITAAGLYAVMRRLDSLILNRRCTENPRRRAGEPFKESASRVIYVDESLKR